VVATRVGSQQVQEIVRPVDGRLCAGVDQASLEAWYAGLGFAPTGEEGPFGPIFARAPEAPEAVRRAA